MWQTAIMTTGAIVAIVGALEWRARRKYLASLSAAEIERLRGAGLVGMTWRRYRAIEQASPKK